MSARARSKRAEPIVESSAARRRRLDAEAEARWASVAPVGYGGTVNRPTRSAFGERYSNTTRYPSRTRPGGYKSQASIGTGITQAQASRGEGAVSGMSGITRAQMLRDELPDVEPIESPEEIRKRQQNEFYDKFQQSMTRGQSFDSLKQYLDFAEDLVPFDATPEVVQYADKVIEQYMPKKLKEEKLRIEEQTAYQQRKARAKEEYEETLRDFGRDGVFYDDATGRYVSAPRKLDPELEKRQIKADKDKAVTDELMAKEVPEDWAIIDANPDPTKYEPRIVPRDLIGKPITKGDQVIGRYDEIEIEGWKNPYWIKMNEEKRKTSESPDDQVVVWTPKGYIQQLLPRSQAELIVSQWPEARIETQTQRTPGF